MAFFGVTKQVVKAVQAIPNSDRIELASLEGLDFDFVIGKGTFRPGDACLYIPIDSILPAPLIEKMDLKGKLAGPEQNRVKTAVLRGATSQGLVVAPFYAPEALHDDPVKLTEYLGVTKWDPPMNDTKDAILYPLTDGLSEYDIESAQRYQNILDLLMDRRVFITEKLEGCNASVRCSADAERSTDDYHGDKSKFQVACRTNVIVEKDGFTNMYWAAARQHFDENGLWHESLLAFTERFRQHCGKPTTVYFELLGPGTGAGNRKNYYQFEDNTYRIFDIRANQLWLNPDEMKTALAFGAIGEARSVPVVARDVVLRDWLAGRTVKEAADGDSLLRPGQLREGIVIRPMIEDKVIGFGRLQLKQHSLRYLAGEK